MSAPATTTIFAIETAIIKQIGLVNQVANFGAVIKTVDRYSGDFADESIDRLMERAPFCLVSHTASQLDVASATGARWRGEFVVVCGAASMRVGSLTSRVGGPSAIELGSRQMAELVRDLLLGQTLGLPIRALMPEAIDEVYSGSPGGAPGQHKLSVTGIRLSCLYSTARNTAGDGGNPAAPLLEMWADWVAPGTPTTTDLPLNPAPDFSSNVQF